MEAHTLRTSCETEDWGQDDRCASQGLPASLQELGTGTALSSQPQRQPTLATP